MGPHVEKKVNQDVHYVGSQELVISHDYIKKCLQESKTWSTNHGSSEIKEVRNSTLCEPSVGFVSQINRLLVVLSNEETIPIVVKTPELHAITNAMVKTMGESERYFMREKGDAQLYSFIADYFNRECLFYRSVEKSPKLSLPKIYSSTDYIYETQECGSIMMEDLAVSATNNTIFDSLTFTQVCQLSQQIADLQENSIRNHHWAEKFVLHDGYMEFFSKMGKTATSWSLCSSRIGGLVQKVAHLYNNLDFWNYVYRQSYKDLGIPVVQCHGDMWTYNFLWVRDGEGKPSEELSTLLDWQNVHQGSCGEDLGRLLMFCCDVDVRHRAEQEMLPKFYDYLTEQCRKNNVDVPYTFMQLKRAYLIHSVAQGVHFTFMAKIMLSLSSEDDDQDDIRLSILERRVHAALEDCIERIDTEMPQFKAFAM